MAIPKISFGIIVLNGQPFTHYCLKSLYTFAHEIIIVEGASYSAKEVATADGHSKDDTLNVIRNFIKNHDPLKKVTLVTAEDQGHPNGFWPGEKDQQSQAYAARATGDYLWQVDIDEFYMPQEMNRVIMLLQQDPTISGMSFKTKTFWGSTDVTVDGPFLLRGAEIYQRLFKWGKGYRYATHRPPTVLDEQGVDVMKKNFLHGTHLAKKHAIYMLHYSLLFPKQVKEKAEYYQRLKQYDYQPMEWYKQAYRQLNWPFRYHNVYLHRSWLLRYLGGTPDEVSNMIADIKNKKYDCLLREDTDVKKLLGSWRYQLNRTFWQLFWPYESSVFRVKKAIQKRIMRLLKRCHLVTKVN